MVESQGWTQYVSQELNCSEEQSSGSQERDVGSPGTLTTFLGAANDLGTLYTFLGTDHEILETP